VPTGLASLIIATVPLWVVLLRLLAGEKIPRVAVIGVLAGFVGVARCKHGGAGHRRRYSAGG